MNMILAKLVTLLKVWDGKNFKIVNLQVPVAAIIVSIGPYLNLCKEGSNTSSDL